MKESHIFWWGCFGALLPELLRFFKLAAAGQPLPALNWPLYVGLLVLFVVAAGAFTVAWKAESAFKAIWVGASVPTLIATLIQVAPAIPRA
jgi:CDP-diglyceride synthetase